MIVLWLSMINSSGIRRSRPFTYLRVCFLDFFAAAFCHNAFTANSV